jgi:uncharacterized protein with PIN domain
VTLYLDTSSLVKLYVTEAGTEDIRQLVGDANVVATSVVAYAETRAALARLRREGALTASTLTSAKRAFEEQWPSYLTLEATDACAAPQASSLRSTAFEASTASTWRRSPKSPGGQEPTTPGFPASMHD